MFITEHSEKAQRIGIYKKLISRKRNSLLQSVESIQHLDDSQTMLVVPNIETRFKKVNSKKKRNLGPYVPDYLREQFPNKNLYLARK